MSKTSWMQDIIERLRDPNVEVRVEASDELCEVARSGLDCEEGCQALRAAVNAFPPLEEKCIQTPALLVGAARWEPFDEYIPIVQEVFPLLPDAAQYEAISLLNRLESRAAAEACMDLFCRKETSQRIERFGVGTLTTEPRHADVFFPRILEYVNIERFEYDICKLTLSYCEKALIADDTLEPIADHLLAAYRESSESVLASERSDDPEWCLSEEYEAPRARASLLLDLFGFVHTPDVTAELLQALDFRDPRLKCFAAVSLLRNDVHVDDIHLNAIASDAEMRNLLFDKLIQIERLHRFPKEYRNQNALAESSMVNWLVFPTELGRAPDEIELMSIEVYETKEHGNVEFFVYRFRTHPPHWAADDGWMAGVAGPFQCDLQPTTSDLGYTFSRFEPWDSKSAEEHVECIINQIDDWRGASDDTDDYDDEEYP